MAGSPRAAPQRRRAELFDVYPDENVASTVASVAAGTNGADNAGTQPYNAISPYGFNGRTVFVRAGVSF